MTILLNWVLAGRLYPKCLLFRAVTPEVCSNFGLLGKIVLRWDMPHPSKQSSQGHPGTEQRAWVAAQTSFWIKKLLIYGWLDFSHWDKRCSLERNQDCTDGKRKCHCGEITHLSQCFTSINLLAAKLTPEPVGLHINIIKPSSTINAQKRLLYSILSY